MKIGLIGQGWIGRNYGDDFERRGYVVIRYALEAPYDENKDAISQCDTVFIAVPTPTTKDGFDSSIVESVVKLLKPGACAIIKSTMRPGSTDLLQQRFKDRYIFHSPEFLTEKNAQRDARAPQRNIVGIPDFGDTMWQDAAKKLAGEIIKVLPCAPYEKICSAKEAELIKYAGNNFLYTKVLFANIIYELADSIGADWEAIKEAVIADPRIGPTHWDPVHQSGHGGDPARGAGGHCFIKDFAAMRELYSEMVDDASGLAMIQSIEEKNKQLLINSNKDLDLLDGVYGIQEDRVV